MIWYLGVKTVDVDLLQDMQSDVSPPFSLSSPHLAISLHMCSTVVEEAVRLYTHVHVELCVLKYLLTV